MSRVHIDLPEVYVFKTELAVQIGDINYGNHLANDAVLRLAHEARMRFLQHHGYTEMNIDGAGLIMADAAIEFKNEAFYNDTLTIWVTIDDVQKINFDIFYKIEKTIDGKVIPVANAKTGMICFDYEKRKVAAISSLALETIKNL